MKIFALALSALVFTASTAQAGYWPGTEHLSKPTFYIGAEGGWHSIRTKSGGINLEGPALNTGSDRDKSGHVGINLGADFNVFALDLSYRRYNGMRFNTNSVPGFRYNTNLNTETLMLSVPVKLYAQERWDIYAGPGIGFSRSDASTRDPFVRGSVDNDTNFAWQLELGSHYSVTDHIKLGTGIRYVDMGKVNIPLKSTIPSGGLTSELTSSEIFAGIQYSF